MWASMPAEPTDDPATLDAALQEAARAGDAGRLASAYQRAAERARGADEAGFFLTHAYVWALVAGDGPAAARLARISHQLHGRRAVCRSPTANHDIQVTTHAEPWRILALVWTGAGSALLMGGAAAALGARSAR